MNLLARIFGRRDAAPSRPNSQLASTHSHLPSGQSQGKPADPSVVLAKRRELLKVSLRDTLRRHGIPADWIGAEMLAASSRSRAEPAVHWRLSVRHWDERLPNHLVALQNALAVRVLSIDPMASDWLSGISWQFALADEAACPALPHPGLWTSMSREQAAAAHPVREQPSADVIAGPVSVETHSTDVKADLERLMGELDAQYQQGPQPSYAKTEPSPL